MKPCGSDAIPIPSWLYVALGEIGVRELPRRADNERIREYHASTTLGASPDSVPWCSAFVNWCLNRVHRNGTASARARSFETWGAPLIEPQIGCIVVLWRKSPTAPAGHVGFWLGARDGQCWLLGGNQGNAVSVRGYPLRRVLSYRWPT